MRPPVPKTTIIETTLCDGSNVTNQLTGLDCLRLIHCRLHRFLSPKRGETSHPTHFVCMGAGFKRLSRRIGRSLAIRRCGFHTARIYLCSTWRPHKSTVWDGGRTNPPCGMEATIIHRAGWRSQHSSVRYGNRTYGSPPHRVAETPSSGGLPSRPASVIIRVHFSADQITGTVLSPQGGMVAQSTSTPHSRRRRVLDLPLPGPFAAMGRHQHPFAG